VGNEAKPDAWEAPEGDPRPAGDIESGYEVLNEESGERFTTATEYAGYALHDPLGREIGKVEKVFVNGNGGPEYVAVKVGSFWRRKTVLIPVQSVAVDGGQQALVLQ